MKYLIWSTGRSGSILASMIIKYSMEGQNLSVVYNQDNERIMDESADIVHCHHHGCFIENLGWCKSIVVKRNIFESTISTLISRETNVWTIRNEIELK